MRSNIARRPDPLRNAVEVRNATTHPREASEPVVLIQVLCAVEKRASERGLDAECRLKLRQADSKLIPDDPRAALDCMRGIAKPDDSFLKAWHHLDAWLPHLTLCADDGRVPNNNNNNNNNREQMMRPVAVGRKNWLFAGSIKRGKNAACFYSMIGTCKLHEIQPFEYTHDVLS